jgi:hypothetical protein
MKKTANQLLPIITVLMLAMFVMPGTLSAQDAEVPDMEIPFIDRDSDGINDLLQKGWGLRFAERYKKRQELWNQLNVDFIKDEDGRMVDTDGDGIGDVRAHDYMMEKMDELIDSDGDGKKDTPLKEYLGGRFKAFDQDGDGLPDDLSAEEVKERMEEMHAWKKEIRDRIHKGESAFTDDDGDGIPDNLPKRFMKRGKMNGQMGGQMGGMQ